MIKLDGQARQGGAAEDVPPTGSRKRNLMPNGVVVETTQRQAIIKPLECRLEYFHIRLLLDRLGEIGRFAASNFETVLLDSVLVFIETPRRRAGSSRSVLVVDTAMAGAHE